LAALPREPVVIPEEVLNLPRWHPRSVWGRYRWKGLFGAIIGSFLLAFVAFDPEVLIYPSHFQGYLESFADALLSPFEKQRFRKIRTHVRVAGGSWKKTRSIERCTERVEEGWLQQMPAGATIVELATRSWKSELARQGLTFELHPVWAKFRRLAWIHDSELSREGRDENPLTPELFLPPVSEMAVGTKRLGEVRGEYTIDLQEVGLQEVFRVKSLMLLRNSDRHHRMVSINEKMYRTLRLATDTWKARVTVWDFGGEPDVRIYVDDLSAPPFE